MPVHPKPRRRDIRISATVAERNEACQSISVAGESPGRVAYSDHPRLTPFLARSSALRALTTINRPMAAPWQLTPELFSQRESLAGRQSVVDRLVTEVQKSVLRSITVGSNDRWVMSIPTTSSV